MISYTHQKFHLARGRPISWGRPVPPTSPITRLECYVKLSVRPNLYIRNIGGSSTSSFGGSEGKTGVSEGGLVTGKFCRLYVLISFSF